MSAAEPIAPADTGLIPWHETWANICRRHPDEWVCLLEIEREADGSIRSARVIGHDVSIEEALDQVDPPNPDTLVVHTAGLPLWTPRTEIIDESRDSF